jgi:hypothetical protein
MFKDPWSTSDERVFGSVFECRLRLQPHKDTDIAPTWQFAVSEPRGTLIGVGKDIQVLRQGEKRWLSSRVSRDLGALARGMEPLRILTRNATGAWNAVGHPQVLVGQHYTMSISGDDEILVTTLDRNAKRPSIVTHMGKLKEPQKPWRSSEPQPLADELTPETKVFWQSKASARSVPWVLSNDGGARPLRD